MDVGSDFFDEIKIGIVSGRGQVTDFWMTTGEVDERTNIIFHQPLCSLPDFLFIELFIMNFYVLCQIPLREIGHIGLAIDYAYNVELSMITLTLKFLISSFLQIIEIKNDFIKILQ